MTADNYLECVIREKANQAIANQRIELCYALQIPEKTEIMHVFKPGTNWMQAENGARTFECDVVQIVCAVNYESLPRYRMYRSREDIELKNNFSAKMPISPKDANLKNFTDVELGPYALRQFESTGTTTFVALKEKDKAYVHIIFPRGTNFDNIASLAGLFDSDIVLIKARVNYEIKTQAKMYKKYEEIRRK